MPSRLPDDDREFAFEIEIMRELWSDDVGEMPGLVVGKSAEHGGILHLSATGFLAVRLIV
jgi:hypothetical protein